MHIMFVIFLLPCSNHLQLERRFVLTEGSVVKHNSIA